MITSMRRMAAPAGGFGRPETATYSPGRAHQAHQVFATWPGAAVVGSLARRRGARGARVVPKPYQQPHPPLFQPFSVSESTIRYTAQSSIVPWILVSNPPDFERLCRLYQDVAAGAGRKLGLGESVGAFRAVHFGRTQEEAVELFRQTNHAGFVNYFGGFGFA